MTLMTERPVPARPKGRSGLWIALAILLAVIAVAGTAWWLARSDVTDDYAAAFEAGDYEAAVELIHEDSLPVWDGVTEWLMATGADDLRFENCEPVEFTSNHVCDVTFGENWIYNRASAEPIVSRMVYEEIDAQLRIVDWPAPDSLMALDAELRDWVEENHPERVDEMWTFTATIWNREGGEARMDVAEEWLASR